jgi:DNA primase
MPSALQRDEFAADAAQKLGIDSAILRQELRQAAASRVESVRSHAHDPAGLAERILLRALVLNEEVPARQLAATRLSGHPELYDGLVCAGIIEILANAPAPQNPLDAAPDQSSRAILARALEQPVERTEESTQNEGSLAEQVEHALYTLEHRYIERRQPEIRLLIAEAERRGDLDMVIKLTHEKKQLDRLVREH